ncbi:ferrochelatase [Magnetospirillum moscoviense]|uniref:Ferrochelatase n=1 Tax=Magnetospirillum moscoviense TaxID=1437059 RepID=A0A178MLF9_9PROT|nr:ferrochelatase [Magnetospirillum moscoviense]OAN49582.1 ferrochelatase [Magnetospirillum moscoviense]
MGKTAVVLFNMGGPDSLEAVEPFLFNLFNDKAIIGAPWPIRPLLAKLISSRRAPVAKEIYRQIGGASPILRETKAQASALEFALGEGFKVFVAMRYWHPFTAETVAAVKAWGADRVVLLPLYPQFSTTTNRSSLRAWAAQAAKAKLNLPTESICCYPAQAGLIAAMAELVRAGLSKASAHGRPRVLFSAHGLPQGVVDRGDPYPMHVEMTARAVVSASGLDDLDWGVCYQSRVGPLKWIGPATEDELARAGADKVPVVVVPIAFVSEHSETLVELDIEYRHRAGSLGIPAYIRVPTVSAHPAFIEGLAELVRNPAQAHGRACSAIGRSCLWKEEP